jgi:hypothetical protein
MRMNGHKIYLWSMAIVVSAWIISCVVYLLTFETTFLFIASTALAFLIISFMAKTLAEAIKDSDD